MNYVKKQKAKNYYSPKNKEKYKGEYPIRVMSQWEYKFCEWCDLNKAIVFWSSEPFGIPYMKPEGKEGRYFFDFLLKVKNKKEKEEIWLIEIKPYKETHAPIKTKKKTKKTLLYEEKTWQTNKAKWKAAQKYCKLKNWKFKIITEKELFN